MVAAINTYVILLLFKILLSLKPVVVALKNNACKSYEAYLNINSNPDCYYMSDNDDNVLEILLKHTSVGETHEVTTEDSYILSLFRIPHENPKDIILLQHGVMTDASIWVAQYNDSVAFTFWKAGYEVWLGNNRGTIYSQKHVHPVQDETFWNHSFHEMGYYDLKATIEYIKVETNRSKIIYIGYSLGSAVGLVYASTRPNEADKSLKLMISLAPIAFLKYQTSPLQNIFCSTIAIQNVFSTLFNFYALLGRNGFTYRMLKNANYFVPYKKNILRGISFIMGWSNDTMDPNYFNIMVNKFGSETSLKTIAHLCQIVAHDGNFQMYDYGKEGNLKMYDVEHPPSYPLYNISIPVFLIHGKEDIISHPQDVELLYNKLPKKAKIYGIMKVDDTNHNDFLFSRHRNENIYNIVIDFLDNTLSN